VLLRLYTGKLKSPTVIIPDFCDYLQKYAKHYLQQAPELVMYLDNTEQVVQKELDGLATDDKVVLTTDAKGKKLVFVPMYYIDRMIIRYREVDERPETPFPLASELPQGIPGDFLRPVYITTDFAPMLEGGERSNNWMNQLMFPDETPPLIYPGSISPEKMLDYALAKIRQFLRKDESRDYIQKRLMMANPGKELTIKNNLMQFQTRPTESLSALKHSGEAFLFWSYLCSFIRQDYVKKTEKTPEEIALLQAVYITEYLNNYYKNRAQQDLQKETALKNLELAFQKPPYYFDMESITRFTDSRGVPLLGQYKTEDLETFITEKTAETGQMSLPILLVFKTEANTRYFILKDKVIPLAIKLSNEARKTIKDTITKEWYKTLFAYRQDNSMRNQSDFEKKVETLCKTHAAVLWSLVNATFIPLIAMETQDAAGDAPTGVKLYSHGKRLPMSELLMLDRQQLIVDTKILLPFWYTFPIISTIMSFLHRPRTAKSRNAKQTDEQGENDGQDASQNVSAQQKKAELRDACAAVEKRFVPAGSTLEQEITKNLEQWNRTLNPDAKQNLTEDVNSLVRDYIRKISRTLKAANFDEARVENLATTLVDTPSLMKIKYRDALLGYVRLYIIKLIKNSK
jgi:hypothetical protein